MTRYSLSEESDEDDEEYEPPHPIGFGSRWDRSSLWLRGDGVPSTTYTLDDGENGDEFTFMTRGSFPPLSLYMTKESTPMLLRYRGAQETFHVYQEDDDVLALQELLQRQCMTSPRFIPTPMKELPPNGSMQIAEKIELERRRMEQEHLAMTRGVQLVLNELDRQTAIVLQERKEADEARQEQELAVKKKIQQQEDEARKRKEVEDAKEQAKAESLAKAEQHKRDEQKRHEDAAAAKTEYVAKARKLVAQLVQIRESVQPFDQNKIVSTRRLGMKKLVGGRINTLAENAERIRQVATEVGRGISDARQEDERVKEALQQKQPGYTPDMARGKRYLVDLLASNTLQRIQADGFNGPRGDGFPLANMLAMVSLENKEIIPILAAHVYTVCPTAIPTLPSTKNNATEEELMESLGMQKDKHGEYETFDKFLSRTESIVAFMSNIMASSPSSHTLFGGHGGAIKWLERFLDLLPDPPVSPLPLLTAPVLHGFLSGAGHMLANVHGEVFGSQIKTIAEDVLNRLDDGPLGKPSSIRLEKLMEGGIEKFRSTRPERALPEFYHGANGDSGHGSHGTNSVGGSMGFGSSIPQRIAAEVGSGMSSAVPSNPFGSSSGGNAGIAASSPFANTVGASSPFGSATIDPASSPFGSAETKSSTSGFGVSPFGNPNASAPSPSPFGGGSQSNPSPFGMSSTTAPALSSQHTSPFGGTSSTAGSSTIGSTTGGFGATGQSSFGAPSPFGSGPAAFGSATGVAAPSPFGSSIPPSATSGFGTSPFQGNTPASVATSTPFGQSGLNSNSTFGASGGGVGTFGGSSSFGGGQSINPNLPSGGGRGSAGGSGGSSKIPCKYFAQGRCSYGDSCKYSHDIGATGGFGNKGGRGMGGSNPNDATGNVVTFGNNNARGNAGTFGSSNRDRGTGNTSNFGNSSGHGGSRTFGNKKGRGGDGGGFGKSFGKSNSGFGGGGNPFGQGGFGGGNSNNPFGAQRR